MSKKGRQVFQEKLKGWHPQLPPRISPNIVTPLSRVTTKKVARNDSTYDTHYKTASIQSGQFVVTEKSARHSTGWIWNVSRQTPNVGYHVDPVTFIASTSPVDVQTAAGHFNCLSVGNKQSLCPLMLGHKRKVGAHRKIFERPHWAPHLLIASNTTGHLYWGRGHKSTELR